MITENELVLNTLAEEAIEVAHRVLKRTRFGPTTNYPGTNTNNDLLIIQEVGDFLGILEMVVERSILKHGTGIESVIDSLMMYSTQKKSKMLKSIELSRELGAIE